MPSSSNSVKLLLGNESRLTPAQREQLAGFSERLEVLTHEDLRRQPKLADDVEVFYGVDHESLGRPLPDRLRWIHTSMAGADYITQIDSAPPQLVITNARGAFDAAITEHVFSFLLMHTRCLGAMDDALRQSRDWRGTNRANRTRLQMLAGRTMGLLGVGAIGSRVARVARALGMRVLGCRRTGHSHPQVQKMLDYPHKLELFAESDVVVNTLPLTTRTRDFVGEAEFAALPAGALFVNVGRGGTVSTEALIEGLRRGRPAIAMLDVVTPEPLPGDHPLRDMEQVYLSPHISGVSDELWKRSGEIFLDNLRRYLAGEPLINRVDLAQGY